jgi:hypothetical protein
VVHWIVPRPGQKINAGLIYSILAAISLKIVSLGTYTAIPSFFHYAVECRLWFPLDVRHCSKPLSLQFHFQFRKQSKITEGQVWRVGRMGNDNHVAVSHKLCGFREHVGGHVMMEQCGACSNFLLTSPGKRHKW